MGALRRINKAVLLTAALSAGARAGASVQVDPIARLSLEGGYDSNVLYDGAGGNAMGRVSPELGVDLRDHTWKLRALAGGDLLTYAQRSSVVWNQRGSLSLQARPTQRWTLESDLSATYAFDPIGLARLGIFVPNATSTLVGGARAKATYRLDHEWNASPLLDERLVRYANATGAVSHSPGLEVTRRVGHRLELGAQYRFDFFQLIGAPTGPGSGDAHAHETQAVARYRLGRRLLLEAQGGAAFFTNGAGETSTVPQGLVQLVSLWRGGGLRFTARHGVGLGLTAQPGLFDALESGITARLGRSFQVHADGGIWRSSSVGGGSAILGYGVEGSFDYRVARGMLIGVGASRFARLDVAAPQFERNVLGLHATWELLGYRRGEP